MVISVTLPAFQSITAPASDWTTIDRVVQPSASASSRVYPRSRIDPFSLTPAKKLLASASFPINIWTTASSGTPEAVRSFSAQARPGWPRLMNASVKSTPSAKYPRR